MAKQTEFVLFRMFKMPCCGYCLCWVNPRLPNYCSECGKKVYLELRWHPEHTIYKDENTRMIMEAK